MRSQNFKSKGHYLLLFFTILVSEILFGQRVVKGVVTDATTSEPLIGANIVLKENPAHGTVTDFDGAFALELGPQTKMIVVSYTGYTSQEFDVTSLSTINVALMAGQVLEDVIVIGYGTVKRDDATGAIQAVTSEKFNRGAITGAQELIAGKVAGVSITTEGSPGAGSKIRIRGESSLSATNDPLIVVDGIPLDNGGVSGSRNPLNIINPNDIAAMSVLKDASATAIYGNRAAGGVILITTKKGSVGSKLSLSYNGNFSVGTKYNKVDVLSATEYRDFINKKYVYDPSKPIDQQHAAIQLLGSDNVDWQELIYQNATGMDHNIGLSGAIKQFPYRLSVGYTDKNGLLKTDNFKRYTTAINLNPGFFDNALQVNLHFKAMLNKNHFADRGAIGNSLNFDPTRGPYDATSKYAGYTAWTVPANGNPNPIAPTNPIALLEMRDDNSTVNQYIANASFDYRMWFLKDLRLNLSLGHDQAKGEGTVIVPNTAAFAFDAINGGGVNNFYTQTKKNTILESYLNYKKDSGNHTFDIMGGYSWQRFYVENYYKNTDTAGTPAETSENRDPAEYFLVSLFSRLNYDYNDRYFLTFSLRRDGTSRFSPDARWGFFPAAALAVKLIDNDNNYLNSVKLRTGWGVTGQQDIGDYYAYLARYQVGTPNAQYQFGNEFVTTLRPNGYDANIKWEETSTYNLAVDFSLIKNKLTGSVDIYHKLTKDLLNRIPVPAGTNLTNFITTNVGNMENKGIEVILNTTPTSWLDLSVNVTHNQPKITKLTAVDDPTYKGIATGGIAGGVGSNIQIHSVGYAPSSFYVYKQKYDEQGNILEGQFEDVNGDGVVNSSDFYHFKSPNPYLTLGLTGSIHIKNFDLSFAGRANLGNYVYNNVQTDMGYQARAFASNAVLWNIHQAAIDNNVNNQSALTFSDHYVRDASFFRMDHITLAYNFEKVFNGLRVYTTVQNPIVVTKYDGLDPEIGNGIDNNIYPRPRTFLAGVSVNF
ncbi:MAG: SusC/RagA family TonB-linked outer membrane protein [Saprospiraceae bacterium]|nr:SusC/RagA family TonB-linked outer membrane protein [Saprospiraceae bacterium]